MTNAGSKIWWHWQHLIWVSVWLVTLSHFRLTPTSTQTKSPTQNTDVGFLHSCQGLHHFHTFVDPCFSPSPGDVNITSNSLEVPVSSRHGHHGFVAAEEELGRQELAKFILVEPEHAAVLVDGNTFVLRYTDWTLIVKRLFSYVLSNWLY